MLWILLYWTADMVEYILELQVYIQLVNYRTYFFPYCFL